MSAARLTQRELRAISEALAARLAAEIEDVGDLTCEDYESAQRKIGGRVKWRADELEDWPMTPKTPSRRWRIATAVSAVDLRSEREAYDALNDLAADKTIAGPGTRVTVHHWENGRWVLYERVVITENRWEPA